MTIFWKHKRSAGLFTSFDHVTAVFLTKLKQYSKGYLCIKHLKYPYSLNNLFPILHNVGHQLFLYRIFDKCGIVYTG